MVDWEFYEDADFSQFEFLVAAGAMTFVYVLFTMFVGLFDLASSIGWMALAVLALDGVFAFFMIVAGIAATDKCNEKPKGSTQTYCKDEDNPKAAAVSSFLLCVFFAAVCPLISPYSSFSITN